MQPSANNFIPRPRLENLLRDALQASPLVMLAAPFGYGKSTLIEGALRDRADSALFRAQPWHRGAFIEELVGAVRAVRPDFGRRTLASAATSDEPASIARFFLADLRHVPETLILAIDNIEHLTEDPAFTGFLDTITNDVPAHVHLLVAGRALPPLRAQTLVRAAALTIPPDALLFSEEELAAALELHGTPADEVALNKLMHATKGWPASVSLTLRSGDLGMQYVSEVLLSSLDDEARNFLGSVSVFERIDANVLEGEAAYQNFRELLERIERAGAPLGRDDFGYTLHPLVRAFGLTELKQNKRVPEAHAAAARAFARHGNLAAALFHIRASGDEGVAALFLREFGESIVRTGNHDAIRETLNLLRSKSSEDVRAYVAALLSKNTGGDETSRHLEAAAASKDPRIAFGARAEQIERTIAQSGSADSAALDDLARRAEHLGVDARARSALFRAWSNAVSFDFDGALRLLEPYRDLHDASARFNTGVLYGYARASRGETDAALAELDALVRLFENDDRVVFEALTLVWQARIALLAGRMTVAGDAARAARRIMEDLSIRAEEAALYFALTELATHEGDVAQTVVFAERLNATAPSAWYAADAVRARAFAETALARAAFLGSDVPTALDLARRVAANKAFPSVQRAVAFAEATAYAGLLEDGRVKTLYEQARRLSETAQPRDSSDAVALSSAIDLLTFLAHIYAWPETEIQVTQLSPFRALLDARLGLVTMEHAAIALRNLRAGKATQEPFNAALAQMARDGHLPASLIVCTAIISCPLS